MYHAQGAWSIWCGEAFLPTSLQMPLDSSKSGKKSKPSFMRDLTRWQTHGNIFSMMPFMQQNNSGTTPLLSAGLYFAPLTGSNIILLDRARSPRRTRVHAWREVIRTRISKLSTQGMRDSLFAVVCFCFPPCRKRKCKIHSQNLTVTTAGIYSGFQRGR